MDMENIKSSQYCLICNKVFIWKNDVISYKFSSEKDFCWLSDDLRMNEDGRNCLPGLKTG